VRVGAKARDALISIAIRVDGRRHHHCSSHLFLRIFRRHSAGVAASFATVPMTHHSSHVRRRGWLIVLGVGLLGTLRIASGTTTVLASTVNGGSPARFTNSLGMQFLPVPGTDVLFSIWDTRVQDFATFVGETTYDATANVMSMTPEGGRRVGATWKNPGFEQGPTHPVCAVSWEDAHAFCAWLTKKERAAGRITTKQTYRLPTDAEWSLAAGLRETTQGTPESKSDAILNVYPWGTQWPPADGVGNYAGTEARTGIWPADWGVLESYRDNHPRTSPVGSYPPNQFGLFDMGGNVWQWCEDDFNADGHRPVLRGGSFLNHFQKDLLSSHRFKGSEASARSIFLGFRCVLTDG